MICSSGKMLGAFIYLSLVSQNHRIVWVGRDIGRSSCPIPLLQQSHLDPVARAHVLITLEYLSKDGNLTICLGNLQANVLGFKKYI